MKTKTTDGNTSFYYESNTAQIYGLLDEYVDNTLGP